MSLPNGRYPGRGVTASLGKTEGGNPQVAVELVVTTGEHQGKRITWFGFFTDKTTERTLESLRHLGWEGDNLADLSGIDRNEVSFDVEAEEYKGEWKPKVRWINAPGGLALKQPMTPAESIDFATKMMGAVIAHRQKMGVAPRKDDQDVPF